MKLPRRSFLHLAAGAAALPTVSRSAWALGLCAGSLAFPPAAAMTSSHVS
jgi:hypothetical protein